MDRNATTGKVWYFPFFVTIQEKARIVYDGAATFRGKCLNEAVLVGTKLLNNLVEVLIRFQIEQCACIADLSKCFFKRPFQRHNATYFALSGSKIMTLISEKSKLFFARHVWGINFSPHIALTAIKNVVNENVTGASQMI